MRRANLKKTVDIFLFVLMVAGFILISLDAMIGGSMYWREVQKIKLITFIVAGILCARLLYRTTRNKSIFVKSLSLILTSLIFTVIIFFYNNWLHMQSNLVMFNYKYEFNYLDFLAEDLAYSQGMGLFRYILFFALQIVVYLYYSLGVYMRVSKFVDVTLEKLANIMYNVLKELIKIFETNEEACEEANIKDEDTEEEA